MPSARIGLFLATVFFTALLSREADAATATWATTTNGSWSDGASWASGQPPAAGDDLVFPSGPSGVVATNDFPAGTAFGKISIAGDGYTLDGNAIVLGGDITVTSGTTGPTFALPISIDKSITIASNTPGLVTTTFLSAATFDLGPNTLSVSGDGKTSFSGKISGPGAFNRESGIGETIFAVDNNYLGLTTVNAGTLTIKSDKALGGKNIGTKVQGTGSLRIMTPGALTFDEPLVLASTAFASFTTLMGSHTWAGPIALEVDSRVGTNAPFEISGTISGIHVLKITSPNSITTLSGDNTYGGGTLVASGGVMVTKPSALGSGPIVTALGAWITVANGTYPNGLAIQGSTAPHGGLRTLAGSTTWEGSIALDSPDSAIETAGTLIVTGKLTGPGGITKLGAGELDIAFSGADYAGGTSVNEGTLRCTVASAIPDASPTWVDTNGTLAIDDGLSETIGSLTGSQSGFGGKVTLGNGVILTTGGNGRTTGFDGVISGNASVVFTGAGTKYLNGANTYTGATSVNGGTVAIHANGSLVSATTVAPGARLAIAQGGAAGAITSNGGTFAPGWLPTRNGSSASVALNGASTFAIGIDGNGVGEASHLSVTGTVALGGATLTIALGYTPAIGEAFTVIDNDGVDAIDGTFAGLAENGIIGVGASYFRVSYAGGDGNDVVLTTVVAPPLDAGVVDGGSGDGGFVPDSGVSSDAGGSNDAGATADGSTSNDANADVTIDSGSPSSERSAGGGGCDCRAATDAPSEAPYALSVMTVLALIGLGRLRGRRA